MMCLFEGYLMVSQCHYTVVHEIFPFCAFPVLQETTPSSMAASQFNYLPNDKFLDRSKLKAPVDKKINVTENLKFVLVWIENILRKGENASY